LFLGCIFGLGLCSFAGCVFIYKKKEREKGSQNFKKLHIYFIALVGLVGDIGPLIVK
jgi:hypothetical protein